MSTGWWLFLVLCFGLHGVQTKRVGVLVLDETRAPIAQARATTFEGANAESVTSDSNGACSVPIEVGAPPFRLRVERDGFFHVDSTWFAQEQLTVVLRRATELRGRVTEAGSTRGVAGADVRLVHPGCRHCETTGVTADAEGRYVFDNVPIGVDLEMHVGADGFARQRVVLGSLSETERTARDISIERGLIVRGKVLDMASGNPLANARLATIPGQLNETRTAADGTFELRAVAESFRQLVRFEAQTDEHCKLSVVLAPNDLRDDRPLLLPLPRFCALEGNVLDVSGAPLAGAEVFLREDAMWLNKRRARGIVEPRTPLDDWPSNWTVSSGTPNASTVTDAQGNFRFERVTPWMNDFLVHSRHASGATAQQMVAVAGAPTTTSKITLRSERAQTAARISGLVTLNGIPMAGVLAWRGPTRSGKLSIDGFGKFSADNLEPGEIDLAVETLHSLGFSVGSALADRRVKLTTSLDTPVSHDLALTHELAKIRGRVKTTSGSARVDLPVAALEAVTGSRTQARTNADGTFEIEVLSIDRPWTVLAYTAAKTFERTDARIGGEPVEFIVPDSTRVQVRFVDAQTRASLSPAQVLWRNAGSEGVEARSPVLTTVRDQPGLFTLELPVGTLDIGAWVGRASYPPSAPRTIAINAETPLIEFELTEGRSLEVRLSAEIRDKPRDPAARLWLLEREWWAQVDSTRSSDQSRTNVHLPALCERFRALTFDANGRAHVPGLRPGLYRWVTTSSHERVEPEQFEFKGTSGETLEIRWTSAP